jgi:hypothetical protein
MLQHGGVCKEQPQSPVGRDPDTESLTCPVAALELAGLIDVFCRRLS